MMPLCCTWAGGRTVTLELCAAYPSSRQPGILTGTLRLVRVKGTCVFERPGAGCKVTWRHVQGETESPDVSC
jgi:hypothetical protein